MVITFCDRIVDDYADETSIRYPHGSREWLQPVSAGLRT